MTYRPIHLRRYVAVLMIAIVLQPDLAYASWLSEITGIDVNVPAGTISFSAPNPAAIPEMLKNLPADILEFASNCLAGTVVGLACPGAWMATLVREGKAAAQGGAQPIPPYQRAVLANFFAAYILDKARWTLAVPNRSPVEQMVFGGNCPQIQVFGLYIGCENGALTLDNLIIFKDLDHEANYVNWAHELTHVSQYDGMGIDGFAYAYTVDPMNLEGQALAWQNTVYNAVTHPSIQPTQPYWTMQPVRRVALTAQDFIVGAARLTSNPAWVQAHSGWRRGQDCNGMQGPGTDTGISYQDSDRHLSAGLDYESNQNWGMAIAEYREAVRTNPTNANAYDRLGVVLAKTGQAQFGVDNIKHAICLDTSPPKHPGFRADLASAYSASGALNAAVNEYQLAIFWSGPQNPQLRRDLAAVLNQMGQSDAANMQTWAAGLISNAVLSGRTQPPPPPPPLAASVPSLSPPSWLKRTTWEANKTFDWITQYRGSACRTSISKRVLFDPQSDSVILQYVENTHVADDASDFCLNHSNDPAIKTHIFVRLRLALSPGYNGAINITGALEDPCSRCSLPKWSPRPTVSGMIMRRTDREFWLSVDGLVHGGFQMEPTKQASTAN
jgi:tetratricopeptide (TPR) repeat protein